MSTDPATFVLASPLEYTPSPSASGGPVGVDIDRLVTGLADDHIDAPADIRPGLSAVVERAEKSGHDLYVVVLERAQPRGTYYRDIADAVESETGGTVLVFGPRALGTASDDFSRVQLEQAQVNAKVSNPAVATDQVWHRIAEEPQTPWTVVTLALIATVAVGAVVARWLQRRARRSQASAESTAGDTAAGSPSRNN